MNKKKEKQHKLNSEIKHQIVRVGEHGVMPIKEAQQMADDQELDLVLLNENTNPPVCKIMNYEKFIYEQGKKDKQKSLDVKEIKIGPNTSENDLDYRIKHMCGFLQKGHKVKITMQFKGREMSFSTKGEELMLKLILKLTDFGSAEAMPKFEGKKMFVTIKPVKK
jgi:translation initiation factor IF-3